MLLLLALSAHIAELVRHLSRFIITFEEHHRAASSSYCTDHSLRHGLPTCLLSTFVLFSPSRRASGPSRTSRDVQSGQLLP